MTSVEYEVAKQPSGMMFLKCKNVIAPQNMLIYILCPIAYISIQGVDASKANLLKKALA